MFPSWRVNRLNHLYRRNLCFLSTERVDYVEEPMGGGVGWVGVGVCGVLVRDVVGGGQRVGSV